MPKNKERLYTIGEFAENAGVTIRTLRYYDNIDLLKPCCHNEFGHRLYSKEDFGRLQKILTLKFIGLSLEDISNIIKYDLSDNDFKKPLEIQKSIMEQKVQHIQMVIKAIDEAVHMLDNEHILDWNKFINIINVINIDKKWIDQYENASNLRARIRIHELFSTNNQGWMDWFFEQMKLPSEGTILELGCGEGTLWKKNFNKLSVDLDITLTDFSQGMIRDAKKNLGVKSKRFKFEQVDAHSIPFKDCSFDIVIANHMLYHISDKEKAFSEIKRVLKPNGYFYASTIGRNHMKEMRDIIAKFNCEDITSESWSETESFQLENGLEQVSEWFKEVKLKRYKDSLKVKSSMPLVDYIFSMPGNRKGSFDKEKLENLIVFLEKEISESGEIYITKDTGFFRGKK